MSHLILTYSGINKYFLLLQVPLENVTYDGQELVVGLGMLFSWDDTMGKAKIMCVQGCTCPEREFSTQIQYSGYSMTYWQFLRVLVSHVDARHSYLQALIAG